MYLEDTVDGSRQCKGTSGAAHVLDLTAHAGEPGSGVPLDAIGYYECSDYIDATGATVVYTGACIYGGIVVLGAAGAHTATIYDNTAASGTVRDSKSVAAAVDGTLSVGRKMDNGITISMSGDPTNSQIFVLYKPL